MIGRGMLAAIAIAILIGSATIVRAADTALAIVVEDQSALRAEPRRSATQHAVLWAGDTLEVRGERLDYLQFYDHLNLS